MASYTGNDTRASKAITRRQGVIVKLAAFILAFLLTLTQPVRAAQAGQDLLLFYSNDVHGETAPCG